LLLSYTNIKNRSVATTEEGAVLYFHEKSSSKNRFYPNIGFKSNNPMAMIMFLLHTNTDWSSTMGNYLSGMEML